jgi:glycogen operon protein
VNERGEPILGDTLVVLLNGHSDEVAFTLPPFEEDQLWHRVFDTYDPHGREAALKPGAQYPLQGRSIAVFQAVAPVRERRRVSDRTEEAAPESMPAATQA